MTHPPVPMQTPTETASEAQLQDGTWQTLRIAGKEWVHLEIQCEHVWILHKGGQWSHPDPAKDSLPLAQHPVSTVLQ